MIGYSIIGACVEAEALRSSEESERLRLLAMTHEERELELRLREIRALESRTGPYISIF